MECRAGVLLWALTLALASWPQHAQARRRVVIEVPVHIRSHQHTRTVYSALPVVSAVPVPVLAVQPLQPLHHYAPPPPPPPATVVQARPAAQKVAHHAAPGGLTSITLVNLGRGGGGGHTPKQADDGVEGDAEETPTAQQRQRPPRMQPQPQAPAPPQQQQRHHVSGVNYQHTEHTAQVYRR